MSFYGNLILLTLFSCNNVRQLASVESDNQRSVPVPVAASSSSSSSKREIAIPALQHIEISPGQVKLLVYPRAKKFLPIKKISCDQQQHPFFEQRDLVGVFLSIPYFYTGKKKVLCQMILSDGQSQVVAKLSIVPYSYPAERLHVDKKRVFLSKRDLARLAKENIILDKVYAESSARPLFRVGFANPLESYVTSKYGTARVYNKHKKSYHFGTDYRAKIGTPIRVSNAGKIVFAGNLFYTGNTVIVDHGLNIFTVYGHLSHLSVRQGQLLEYGHEVGLSGKSGRVTGPHLHWGVKINGDWVDGSALSSQTIQKIPLILDDLQQQQALN